MVERRRYAGAALAVLLTALTALAAAPPAGARDDSRPPPAVHPGLRSHLAAYYDFEHAVRGNPARERDRGFSRTDIDLVGGGARMRAPDGAHHGSRTSLQVRQVGPPAAGNDDWKAGVYSGSGVPTLNAFNAVRGATVMGWFKMTGQNPSPNTNSAAADCVCAIGLVGALIEDSDGHASAPSRNPSGPTAHYGWSPSGDA